MFGLVPFAKNISKDDDFNSLFNIFDEPFFHNTLLPLSATKSFKVDVKDLGSAYELTAELPGIKKENISLNYDKGYLAIKTVVDKKDEKPAEAQGEEKATDKKQPEKYLRRERYYGEMQRSFYIDNIDEANIKAAYKDGILTVTLPKVTEEQTAKTITVD